MSSCFVWAEDTVQQQFLSKAFDGKVTPIKTLWLSKELKSTLQSNFAYTLNRARIRYWQLGQRSAWILDEVGKERPITMGVVIESDKIVSITVLEYRESRGGEIKFPFFQNQFLGAQLISQSKKPELSERVDGITGATLSVRAMKKVAKVALFFHQTVLAPPVNE